MNDSECRPFSFVLHAFCLVRGFVVTNGPNLAVVIGFSLHDDPKLKILLIAIMNRERWSAESGHEEVFTVIYISLGVRG